MKLGAIVVSFGHRSARPTQFLFAPQHLKNLIAREPVAAETGDSGQLLFAGTAGDGFRTELEEICNLHDREIERQLRFFEKTRHFGRESL